MVLYWKWMSDFQWVKFLWITSMTMYGHNEGWKCTFSDKSGLKKRGVFRQRLFIFNFLPGIRGMPSWTCTACELTGQHSSFLLPLRTPFLQVDLSGSITAAEPVEAAWPKSARGGQCVSVVSSKSAPYQAHITPAQLSFLFFGQSSISSDFLVWIVCSTCFVGRTFLPASAVFGAPDRASSAFRLFDSFWMSQCYSNYRIISRKKENWKISCILWKSHCNF